MAPAAELSLGLVGVTSQLGGVALLVALFTSLGLHARRTAYFAEWRRAWVAALVAIAAVALRYSGFPAPGGGTYEALAERAPAVKALYVAYTGGKLLHIACLVLGVRLLVRGRAGLPARRIVVAACAVLALAVTAATPTLNHAMLWQSVVAVPALAWCACALHALPRARRSWGTLALAGVFAALAALWSVYAFGFGWAVLAPVRPNPVQSLLTYNSFVDALLQMLLGYGMVIVLMEDAARVIGAAHAELAAAHDQLRRAALFDPLTGALNRRAFEERLGLERVLAGFGTVAIIDLDDLKPTNDTHGHAVGDAMLRHLVATLSAGLRATDKVFRWGGDEFLVVLPGAVAGDARSRLAALLERAIPLRHQGATLPLRASFGVAEFASADDLVDAISRADAAMYALKGERRVGRRAPRAIA